MSTTANGRRRPTWPQELTPERQKQLLDAHRRAHRPSLGVRVLEWGLVVGLVASFLGVCVTWCWAGYSKAGWLGVVMAAGSLVAGLLMVAAMVG